MPQCFVGHHRPQIGAADADVDDIADRLAGVPLPVAAADAVAEVGHLVEHGMHLRHHIHAVHHDGLRLRGAQGSVQDGALLGDVDLVAPKHGVDARPQTGFLGQLEKQFESVVSDAVLGVVEVDADSLGLQALAALGVVGEKLAEVQFLDFSIVVLQRPPCGALG